MAEDNDTRSAVADVIQGALNALLNVKGAILLAGQVVLREAGPNEALAAAEGVLVLAADEAERLYTLLDEYQRRQRRAEVANG
jgi:hypothetical protein